MKVELSVIVPVYRDWGRLKILIDSLDKQTFNSNLFEVIIVNNDPDSPPPTTLKIPENLIIVECAKPGSYAARNIGIKLATADVLAFTDSDCIPSSKWLQEGFIKIKKGSDLVGGEMVFFKAKETDSSLVFLYEKCFSFNQKRNVDKYKKSITANLFVRRSVFNQLGGFDEETFSGADSQWTKKATDSGFSISFATNSIVKHPSRKSVSELFSKKKRTSGGYFELEFRQYGPFKKIKTYLNLLRPPVKVFFLKNLNFFKKTQLFGLKWIVELVGVVELIQLSLTNRKTLRS
tara:strand:- start:8275 stop:9147 length:873 start_codon:yes stop_codon:yes gene_type:complete